MWLLLDKLLGREQSLLIAIHIFQIEYISNGRFLSDFTIKRILVELIDLLTHRRGGGGVI